MLCLTRRKHESICIGDEIKVTIAGVRGDLVRLGIEADKSIPVHRREVYDAIQDGGFRDIPHWPGYRVNKRGAVQSRRTNSGKISGQWKNKIPSIDEDGYLRLRLHNHETTKFVGVHSLVLQAFVRLPRPGEMALHRNGKVRDNRLENLYWGTAKNNAIDRDMHGTTARGERSGTCKFSDVKVGQIRKCRDETGLSYGKIARRFGVSKRQVMRICKRQVRDDAKVTTPPASRAPAVDPNGE